MTDALRLKNQICHRFYTVSNAFTRAYRPLLKKLDITYPQYVAMMGLWEQSGVTIQELVKTTKIDAGAMTLILKKLQSKGYLEVVQGEEDKRTRFVHLTEKGKAAENEAESIPQQLICKVDTLEREEALTLISLIDKLSQGLESAICKLED
ncbi:MarR family winged helix-turn-helix transcriptional regulator [Alteromonas sp. a30]|uniref:MarR family winged helix-turn-helix transcriptional regulator n=1 Tax=Alteromonas sp. a30 TaxID=2730917 RepID=UPI00227EB937|nr:MarR family transcriptional regulator [Alteromonas sp. a30]MCY7296133.1 MarR family transcriptional regulator [Alteromonas sp. a30]